MKADTSPQLLAQRARESASSPGYWIRQSSADWTPVSWGTQFAAVRNLAAALRNRGVRPGMRFGILAPNSIHWETTQFALLACGASVAGLDVHYPGDTLDQVIRAAQLDGLFASTHEMLARLPPSTLSGLRHVYLLDAATADATSPFPALPGLVSEGDASEAMPDWDLSIPDQKAMVVFSSGTTGVPKPIEYTHRQALLALGEIVASFQDMAPDANLVCWLPLANLFQRIIDLCAVARGNASYIVANPQDVMAACTVANPELIVGVPRFFERVHAGIQERVAASPRLVRGIARWAIRRRAPASGNPGGQSGGLGRRLGDQLSDRLVLTKLRAVFGSRVRYLVSGSAPMAGWLHEFFEGIGLPVYEAYGVSENIVPIAMNRPGDRKVGTVGRVVPSNTVHLGPDGEIRVRGPGVFSGYLGSDDETRMPDAEGFWHTGDVGQIDSSGYLTILGRKSDAFKLSTGRWISPVDVESAIGPMNSVAHVVVTGAGRKVPTVILNLSSPAGDDSGRPSARDIDLLIEQLRDGSGVLPQYQRPAGALLVTTPFSIAGGELTSNLKLRRRAIEEKYLAKLDELYALVDSRTPESGLDDDFPLLMT
ncbi:MAG: long-chain fatty acid--CoA ligase [Vicinamibacterales bacterium]